MFDVPTPSHALLQDPAFAASLRALGQRPITLPCGLTLLNRRICGVPVLMLPRATPPADLRDKINAMSLGRALLILSPPEPAIIPRALRLRAAVSLARIDLSGDQATRRAALNGKWRNQLKRAEADLRVTHAPLPGDPDHPLLLAEAAMARQNRYATWPAALTAMFARLAPCQTRLFTAWHKGTAIAEMLFLLHGAGATYHIGKTTPQGRRFHAHNLLLWQASNWLADQGHTQLNLGPLSPQTPDLNRFKLRAGADIHQTGGTWAQVIW